MIGTVLEATDMGTQPLKDVTMIAPVFTDTEYKWREDRLYVDFETRSYIDLTSTGAHRYTEDLSTQVLCVGLGYAGRVTVVETVEEVLGWLSTVPCVPLTAHNAMFDRLVWNRVLCRWNPERRRLLSDWYCTMAKCYMSDLPAGLDEVSGVLKLGGKHKPGQGKLKKYMGSLGAVPSEDLALIKEYCAYDVILTARLDTSVVDLPDFERKVWVLDQEINDTGVFIDQGLLSNCKAASEAGKAWAKKECVRITGGAVQTVGQIQKIRDYLIDEGVATENLNKQTVEDLIQAGLSESATELLKLRQLYGKTSVAKFKRIQEHICRDGRVKGFAQYYGAHTGRWAGRQPQFQNLQRPVCDVAPLRGGTPRETLWKCVPEGPLWAVSNLMRSLIIGDPLIWGENLIWGDFSSIEARVNAWLAGDTELCARFAAGEDVYCIDAEGVYSRKITKADKQERQFGKAFRLAYGYGGGINATYKACRTFGVSITPLVGKVLSSATVVESDNANRSVEWYLKSLEGRRGFSREEALVADIFKQRYRSANSKVVRMWKDLETAAKNAAVLGGDWWVGPVCFRGTGDSVLVFLPSGRWLTYNKATVTKNGFEYVSGYESGHPVIEKLYGGKWAENIVQAISRDLLCEVMFRMKEASFDIQMHTHDEVVTRTRIGSSLAVDLEEAKRIMAASVVWAPGLPIGCEINHGDYYDK